VACLDELGRPETLSNSEGERLTPSVVLFDGTQIIVGREALRALATEADQIAQCAKRELGSRLFHKTLAGHHFPPEVIEACVLDKLRRDASRRLGEVRRAVVTVPAYFDEIRRKATQDAGYMAGLDVMDIINEPTAAALAFGFRAGLMRSEGRDPASQRILVYDLGGGTFDVTVMEIGPEGFIALATDGDVLLGGYDWDERLVDTVAKEFVSRFGIDPRQDANAHGRLWRICEEAKQTLSVRSRSVLAFDYEGHMTRTEITREEFEELTRDLVDRTAFTVRHTLKAARLEWKDVDRVLLVGGATRMPAVVQMLRDLSGKEPDASVSADEAVAHGAALHAGWLSSQEEGRSPRFSVRNVNSHSLGVVATEPRTGRLRTAVLIPRNTPLPITARRVFRTERVDQRSVLVQIVEGESLSPEGCSPVGQCTVAPLPPGLPAGTQIDVRFRYAANGRLRVHVAVQNTTAEVHSEIIRPNSLTREQLDSWRHFICGLPPGTPAA
jgi:molecular chaperone DnaK